jgi:PAT family beta-lactamase induction signal transducer AmpG
VSFFAIFRSRRMLVLFLFGFSSGLPLYLTGQTLQAWMTSANVSLQDIAAMSLVGLAYTFKFSWAPLLDRYALPFLGRRRGWVLVTQLGLVVAIVSMGLVDPVTQPGLLAVLAVIVAALSASQDIVLDAYNADLLAPEERAAGAAIYVVGYRVAMLLVGTIGLALADYVPWSVIYSVTGALVLVGVAATLIAEEPAAPTRPARSIAQAVYLPFVELYRRFGYGALLVLLFVATYKFGDFFAQALIITFLKRGVGFDFQEIALFYKIIAFAAIFTGGLLAGSLVARFGLLRMLVLFGILQACTNLLYALLGVTGLNYPIFASAVLVDNLTGAMGTAAFVAFQMSVTSRGVSATQLALMTSLTSVGQRVFGPFADDVVNTFDPQGFHYLVHGHASLLEPLRPHLTRAVLDYDLARLAELGPLQKGFTQAFLHNPNTFVTSQDWPWFFSVTAAMAIPGLVLAIAVAKIGERQPEQRAVR